jgi:hypothetical protein
MQRVDVPDHEPFGGLDESGTRRVSYHRAFNSPSGLGSQTIVLLKVSHWRGELDSLRINGDLIEAGSPPLQIDISQRIEPNNRIELTLVSRDATYARLDGEVVLAILEDAASNHSSSTV